MNASRLRTAMDRKKPLEIGYHGSRQSCATPNTIGVTLVVFWKLAFASTQHGRYRSAMSAMLIAISLIPVLLAVAYGHGRQAARSSSAATTVARSARPDGATLRPLLRRFTAALLIACAAITFLSAWAKVRPRKHEIGVLRSLGASKVFVLTIVVAEPVAVSLGGALLAILIAQGVLTWLNFLSNPAPPYSIGFKWCLAAPSTLIGAAMSGSTIPYAASVQQDVLEMLEWDR